MPVLDTETLGLATSRPETIKVEVSIPTRSLFGQKRLTFLPATIEVPHGWNPGRQLIWTVRNTLCDYGDVNSCTLHTNFAIAEIVLISKKDFRMVTKAGGIQPVQLELTNITPTLIPASKQIRIVATLALAPPQAAPAPPAAEPEAQEPPPSGERWYEDVRSTRFFEDIMTRSIGTALNAVLSDFSKPLQEAISGLLSVKKLDLESVIHTFKEEMEAMQKRHQAAIEALRYRHNLEAQTRVEAFTSLTQLVKQLSELVQQQTQIISRGQDDTEALKEQIQELHRRIHDLLNREV